MQKDPLLKSQGVISSSYVYTFTQIPQKTIDIVSANINLIWVMTSKQKKILPSDIIENIKNIFLRDNIDSEDLLWKEKISAMLREFVDNHFEADSIRLLKSVPKRSVSPDEEDICKRISSYKEFFNNHAHLQKESLDLLQIILNRKNIDKLDQNLFDEVCTNFIYDLERFFKYKMK